MNPCQNSTNELFLEPRTNKDGRIIYFLEQEAVDKTIASGIFPRVMIKGSSKDTKAVRVAILLTRDVSDISGKYAYSAPETLVDSIRLSGAEPHFMVYEKIEEQLEEIKPDGILLPGGDFALPKEWCLQDAAHPKNEIRYQAYLSCLEYAKKNKLPLLGICAGMQVLGGYHSAKIIRVENHRGVIKEYAHGISIKKNSLLYHITGLEQAQVNSNHSEAVSKDHLGDCVVSAVAKDGTVEALELKNPWVPFVLGIQSHPEYFVKSGDKFAVELFQSFVKACKNV